MATTRQKAAARRNIKKARSAQSRRASGQSVPRRSPGLSTEQKNRMRAGTFAFPKERKEPLNDARHVRNAIARFDQVHDVGNERDEAFRRIKRAANNVLGRPVRGPLTGSRQAVGHVEVLGQATDADEGQRYRSGGSGMSRDALYAHAAPQHPGASAMSKADLQRALLANARHQPSEERHRSRCVPRAMSGVHGPGRGPEDRATR
jgi:hypothetical protein